MTNEEDGPAGCSKKGEKQPLGMNASTSGSAKNLCAYHIT